MSSGSLGEVERFKIGGNLLSLMEKKLTRREEANAITCSAFRNGFLEDLHAGEYSELLENPKLSRITDSEMKRLMIQASEKIMELLEMKDENPEEYWQLVKWFSKSYCGKWDMGIDFTRHLGRGSVGGEDSREDMARSSR